MVLPVFAFSGGDRLVKEEPRHLSCRLWARAMPELTIHHRIARQQSKRRDSEPGALIALCTACHWQIHALFDNHTLVTELNTREKLGTHPEMDRFLEWIQKQAPEQQVKVRNRLRRHAH